MLQRGAKLSEEASEKNFAKELWQDYFFTVIETVNQQVWLNTS